MRKDVIHIFNFFITLTLLALAWPIEAQQVYPNKLLRVIVPFPAGGSTDVLARFIAQKLSSRLGQIVIVDNRPGGNTVLGTAVLAKSQADGYTVMLMTSTHVLNSLLMQKLPYDSVLDFTPIASICRSEYLLVLHPSIPARNLQEFIKLAKARPSELNYATSGSGTAVHLGVEMLSAMVGIKMEHIPYKGSAAAVIDLISGQVQVSFIAPINVLSHIKAGKLKAIAFAGDARSQALPMVPTFIEAGLLGFTLQNWYGILAPAGIPSLAVEKLSTEIAQILTMPDTRVKLVSQGMDIMIAGPELFAKLMKEDMTKYGKVIKSANIKLEY